ncbi:S41 family peptidase [Caldisalinibacter kiritimatiensis]|uniref:Carboxyl-terminal protease n=1 Tax=Caldisalinibacter kiritimatiensis TaxID=1304284 RepID=R1AQZ6_9FIRM|nr:S41 family peptidase [Caldisalinibacter kiritimatiensis]EOC99552.1 Carboxyl-terminal protease [Caldisalinibacter kiritimatiensis]
MISKRKAAIGAIILIIITGITTFAFSNMIQITIGDKVFVTKEQRDEWVEINNKYNKLMALEDIIEENFLYEVNEQTLLEGALKGMFQALDDPYSVYMTKDEFADFMEHTRGTYSGIGIIVVPGEDNLITVVSPIEGTPGERAGIKTGDKIVKVNGKEFTADRMDEAVKVMKGKPGTKVEITILRKNKNGDNKFLDLEITREEIRQKTVKAKMLEGNIGYIRLVAFDEKTYGEFKNELDSLEKKNMKGIIIDLRNNPGGLLDQCQKITDELMGEGIIVYTETKKGEREEYKSDKEKIDVPLVLLVNGGSASASEILAGAIKDTNSGVLIGTKTFGKGIVQRIIPLKDGSGFKLTVSEYFTPSGVNIHGVGIEPDIVIELPDDVMNYGTEYLDEDIQLQKAIEVIKSKIK